MKDCTQRHHPWEGHHHHPPAHPQYLRDQSHSHLDLEGATSHHLAALQPHDVLQRDRDTQHKKKMVRRSQWHGVHNRAGVATAPSQPLTPHQLKQLLQGRQQEASLRRPPRSTSTIAAFSSSTSKAAGGCGSDCDNVLSRRRGTRRTVGRDTISSGECRGTTTECGGCSTSCARYASW
jgi:hypothetical protein